MSLEKPTGNTKYEDMKDLIKTEMQALRNKIEPTEVTENGQIESEVERNYVEKMNEFKKIIENSELDPGEKENLNKMITLEEF